MRLSFFCFVQRRIERVCGWGTGGMILGVASGAVAMLVLAGCPPPGTPPGPAGPGPGPAATQPGIVIDEVGGKYTLFLHPADPRVVQFVGNTGETVTLSADKDQAGNAIRISSLLVQEPAELAAGLGTRVEFDGQDRISRVVGPDGAIVTLTWQSDTLATATATSGDGGAQVNTTIDSSQGGAPTAKSGAGAPAEGAAASPGDARKKSTSPTGVEPNQSPAPTPTALRVNVSVTVCGGPVTTLDPKTLASVDVSVVIDRGAAGPPVTLPAQPQADGGFAANVPLPPAERTATEGEIRAVCNGLAVWAINFCSKGNPEQALSLLSGIVTAQVADEQQRSSIQRAILQATKGVNSWCAAVELAGLLGPEAIGDQICSNLKAALKDPLPGGGALRVRATVVGQGAQETNLGDLGSLVAGGSFITNTNVQFTQQEPLVLGVITEPEDPAPGQDYTITARVLCATGRTVTINVTGSELPDPFTQSDSFTPQAQDEEVSTTVPGGGASIIDTIDVLIDGVPEKQISIVF